MQSAVHPKGRRQMEDMDLEAIRSKWLAHSGEPTPTAAACGNLDGNGARERNVVHPPLMDVQPVATDANQCCLDKYVICRACGGLGMQTYTYNHMRLEKTCPECNGDSIKIREAGGATRS